MRACRYHHADYMSPPEAYANARCRGSGPPNEERRGDEPRRSVQKDCEARLQTKPTASALQVQRLAALYGDSPAQLAEIDENLCRSELTPTQEAEHLAKRKEVWEAMREAKQVEQLVPAVDVAKHGHAQPDGFASSTAKATGKTKQSVNRAIRRATEGGAS